MSLLLEEEFIPARNRQNDGQTLYANIIILGNTEVGKSAFVNTYTSGFYPGDNYVPTVAATFH